MTGEQRQKIARDNLEPPRRLVVVSNRIADLTAGRQSGGLAVGLADALKARGGLWFGWSGRLAGDDEACGVVRQRFDTVETVGIDLPAGDYEAYYAGFSNSVLWPLFHYRLDLVDYRTEAFEGYLSVNAMFAAGLRPLLEPDDLVWVHDYHLIALARSLRSAGCRQRMGFFLHIPFPPPEMLAAAPNHARLVDALLAHDVIGFQTSTDAINFRRYVEDHTAAAVHDDDTIVFDGRTIRIGRFPIGIDVGGLQEMAVAHSTDVDIDTLRRQILGLRQIIGVDRLDYSKGLPSRMEAFSKLFELEPALERTVTYLQIASPTRENVPAYTDIRRELEHLAGSVNGRYADLNWTPIRYIHRPLSRDRLAALYRASQVGLVTPLRDGMNLVAMEYVAAQDEADPGVLVLSQFAGAAEILTDAVMVNPYDIGQMAQALRQALHMELGERRERHAALLRSVRANDASAWMRNFMAALEGDARTPRDATAA